MAERSYWLVKSEPNAYSFSDLQGEDDGTAEWDGVRNYQARNTMRDDMKVGDGVLFYHSNVKPMAVVGTATVVREGYPDDTAWDPSSDHPDPKSTPDKPLWYMVDIKAESEFALVHGRHQGRERIREARHPGGDQADARPGADGSRESIAPLGAARPA